MDAPGSCQQISSGSRWSVALERVRAEADEGAEASPLDEFVVAGEECLSGCGTEPADATV